MQSFLTEDKSSGVVLYFVNIMMFRIILDNI